MANNDQLLQAIKEVGDLRESIGAFRVKFEAEKSKVDAMLTKLQAMESELADRERDVSLLVRGSSWTPARTPRAKAKAPAAAPAPPAPAPPAAYQPKVVAAPTPPPAAPRTRPFVLRRGSLATRIVDLLNASPDRNFTTHELASQFNIEIRQVYGTLSRLSSKHQLIERVSEGVFRAARKGGATAA